ncbi:ABC transporter ATP-binding protein [Nocardia thraciensis]
MTVEAKPLPEVDTRNKPPRAIAKRRKQEEAEGRRAILAPVRTTLDLASLVVAVASICAVVPYVLIVEICRELLDGPVDTDRVWRLLGIAIGVLVVQGFLQAAAMTWSHLTDAGYQLTVRRALAEKLTRVPLGWFGERSSSEVKTYLRDDVDALHYLVAHGRLDFIGAVTVPLATLVYLCTVDWRLALVLLLPLVAYGIVLGRMMSIEHRDRMSLYTRAEQRVGEATVEFVDGIQVVRMFGQAGRAHDEFQRAVDTQTRSLTTWKRPLIRMQAVSEVIVMPVFIMLVVVIAGLSGVGLGWIAALDVVPFLLVGLGLGSSLLGLGYSGQFLRAAGAAARRLYELQRTPELAASAPDDGETEAAAATAGSASEAAGRVRFESVTFGYRDDREVLRDITLALEPGTITALVGPSGSGKSTLAKLLPRFYDVNSGRITLGGRDIRDYPSDELYRTVGFVFQDVRLLRGTIRENLLLARPDADAAEVERAARAVRIHDRIMALPRGYDSEIGDDAVLSGGEAQRLSIARALLADTPVLVLDEATAFADPESEAAVQDALAVLVANRTVLVIAHRLHTITGVDRILVLDNGRLVEQGTHEELREAGGTYQRLWEINEAALSTVATVYAEETR